MLKANRGRWILIGALALATLNISGCTDKTKKPVTTAADLEAQAAPTVVADPVGATAQYQFALDLLASGKDAVSAQKWLENAAMQGHGDAAFRLGQLQDQLSRQIEWYSMAAAVGQVEAQYALGDAYLNGRGTAKEPAWGLSWLERSARAGHAKAQFSMGVAMATGMTGTPQREEGLVWLLIAEQNGFAHGAPVISALKARLSQTALKQSVERAEAWTNEPAGDAENRALVRFSQYALGRMGFDAGLADGISGDRTRVAVQAFRQAQNLGEGDIDGRMVEILRERLAVFNH